MRTSWKFNVHGSKFTVTKSQTPTPESEILDLKFEI